MIWIVILFVLVFVSAALIIAVPASLSLPRGIRSGLEKLRIAEAAKQLKGTNLNGWELVRELEWFSHSVIAFPTEQLGVMLGDGNPTFNTLGKVYTFSGWFRVFAGWDQYLLMLFVTISLERDSDF